MIQILNSSEIDNLQWQQLVDNSTTASFFQTKECYDFYCSLSFLKPFLYGVAENGNLVGLVCGYLIAGGGKIKQFFSRRAIVPGGVLLANDISEAAIASLLSTLKNELSSKAIYIELRNYNDYAPVRKLFENTDFIYQPHLNFHVHTTHDDSIIQSFSESKRRQVKSAQSEGVHWIETKDNKDIAAFYACLKSLYLHKIRRPLFPLEFFENLVQLSNGKLLVVKHHGKVIGGMACVIFPNNTLYEWFVCGNEDSEKELYPSVFATYAGIDFSTKNNIPHFDFMGAGKPDDHYGVREFKSKFGGKLVQHGRFLYICNKFLYFVGKFVIENRFKN